MGAVLHKYTASSSYLIQNKDSQLLGGSQKKKISSTESQNFAHLLKPNKQPKDSLADGSVLLGTAHVTRLQAIARKETKTKNPKYDFDDDNCFAPRGFGAAEMQARGRSGQGTQPVNASCT